MVEGERIILIPVFCLLLVSILFEITAVTLKIWNYSGEMETIWFCDSANHFRVATYGVCWSILGQIIAFVNLFLALSGKRPKQSALALYRTAAISLYPLGQLIWSGTFFCVYLKDNCDTEFGVGLGLILASIPIQVVCIIICFATAARIRRKTTPDYNQQVTPCTFMVPY